MISLGPNERQFLEAIDTILANTTTEHKNFLVHAYASSENSYGTEQMLALLSSIDEKYRMHSRKDRQLAKLMLLYHKIKNDTSLSDGQNTHKNAQLAYDDLLKHTTLSDQNREIVYGGIVSTFKEVAYFPEKETPEPIKLFLELHASTISIQQEASNLTQFRKKYLATLIRSLFAEKHT